MGDDQQDDLETNEIVVTARPVPQDSAYIQKAQPQFVDPRSDPVSQGYLNDEYFFQYAQNQGDGLGEALERRDSLTQIYNFHGGSSVPEVGSIRPHGMVEYDTALLEQLGHQNAFPYTIYRDDQMIRRDESIALRSMDVDLTANGQDSTLDELDSARRAAATQLLTPEQTSDYLEDMVTDREAGRAGNIDLSGGMSSQLNAIFREGGETGQWSDYQGTNIQGSALTLSSEDEQIRISNALASAGVTNVTAKQTGANGDYVVIVPNGEMDQTTPDDALQAANLLEESRPQAAPAAPETETAPAAAQPQSSPPENDPQPAP